MKLTSAQVDRGCGVLLGTAAGDALGAPYEFGGPRGAELEVAMVGGGGFGWEVGEWTDDTSMAIAIAEVASRFPDLVDDAGQDALVQRWHEWTRTAKDVGIQTRSVLSTAGRDGITAARALAASERHYRDTGRAGGNGSLMRTAPVALAYLDDADALAVAARRISSLTHFEADAGDACVLWCAAIRHAVLTGEIEIRVGLRHLDDDRQALWDSRIADAEAARPRDIPNNGWVVAALQAAWSAISNTPEPAVPADRVRLVLDAAVRAGNDTDTVAAIAGGLIGAAYGASAVPAQWRRILHGWPGLRTRDLIALAGAIMGSDKPFHYGDGRVAVPHPDDPRVWLGDIGALRALPPGVDAVVSLCRVADADFPDGVEQIDVRLIDSDHPADNPNLDFVLLDTVELIGQLRAEGRTVLVHCVGAQRRTPAVGTLYGMRLGRSYAHAWQSVTEALPTARRNAAFDAALRRFDSTGV